MSEFDCDISGNFEPKNTKNCNKLVKSIQS